MNFGDPYQYHIHAKNVICLTNSDRRKIWRPIVIEVCFFFDLTVFLRNENRLTPLRFWVALYSQPKILICMATNQTLSHVAAFQTSITLKFPKRDQAIVLDGTEELQLRDYVIGVRELFSASRISNQRICIYLFSSQIASKLADTYTSTRKYWKQTSYNS